MFGLLRHRCVLVDRSAGRISVVELDLELAAKLVGRCVVAQPFERTPRLGIDGLRRGDSPDRGGIRGERLGGRFRDVGMTERAQGGAGWATLGDPAFDELPILAARMSCVDELDGARAWIGTADQMLLACDGARRRGLRLEVDAEQRATRLFRGNALVSTLLEDPDHAARGTHHLVTPTALSTADIVARLERWGAAALLAVPEA